MLVSVLSREAPFSEFSRLQKLLEITVASISFFLPLGPLLTLGSHSLLRHFLIHNACSLPFNFLPLEGCIKFHFNDFFRCHLLRWLYQIYFRLTSPEFLEISLVLFFCLDIRLLQFFLLRVYKVMLFLLGFSTVQSKLTSVKVLFFLQCEVLSGFCS